MASWNIPALINAIKNDIVGLGSLLRSLAIGDPSAGNTDLPAQSKRMQEGTDGWEWQMFNGNAWNRMAKWNINAAQVDGFNASAGTTANAIPVRDANGDLPGNVLGNAATATKAEKLSATNPVEMGGTGATTPQQARQNLGTPPTEHSSSGTEFGLSTGVKHGHTKLSDATDSSSDVNGGTAATPKAVKTVADSVAALKADVEAEFAATANAQAESDAAQDAAISAAQTSASNAQTSADNAQQSANAAQASANAAQNSANAAQERADSAFEKANNIVFPEQVYYAPNLSAGVGISASTTYTVPRNGFLIAHVCSSSTARMDLTINGATLELSQDDTGHDQICIPVKKGDSVYWSIALGNMNWRKTVTFYPAR